MKRRALLKALGLLAGAQLESGPLRGLPTASRQIASTLELNLFVNQLGYLPESAKLATVRIAAPAPTDFRVRFTKEDHVVFESTLTPAKLDELSGDTVHQAVFSALQTPGEYCVEAGTQRSNSFLIRKDVYADALRTTMRGYTGQRCGCIVDLGNGYHHAPCHLEGEYDSSSGKSGSLPNAGGWHDAGDYGRYIVNSGIICGTLLWVWEMYPTALRRLDLGFPKMHPKLPDFLEEMLWNLNWML